MTIHIWLRMRVPKKIVIPKKVKSGRDDKGKYGAFIESSC